MKQPNDDAKKKLLVFLSKIQTTILDNLSDTDFSINQLSEAVGLSRMQIHRNIKKATGLTTAFYIRKIRMQQACELLKTTDRNIQEIAYEVGYKDPSYFVKVFVATYGQVPKEWRKEHKI